MNNNQKIAEIFEHMAIIYQIKGKGNDGFRARAYKKGALILSELPNDVSEIIKTQKLESLPGIGKAMAEKIQYYLDHGKIQQFEALKEEFPESFLDLLKVQSLGPKKLKILHDEYGVKDVETLEKVLQSGEVEDRDGFGPKSVENILQGIERFKTVQERSLLGDVYLLVKELTAYMKDCNDVEKIESAGSFRRKKETIGDIDFLAIGVNHKNIIQHFIDHPDNVKTLAHGETKGSFILDGGRQVDLRVVDRSEWGSALQYFTGSQQHNVALRSLSKDMGIKLNEYGAFQGEKKIAGETEESMYECLGLQWVPPEMREDRGEIQLAQKKEIPLLLSAKDIKGDLHMHSTYSDGKNSIEEMAQAAINLGYEYIAITDHSPSLPIANGVGVEDLQKKKAEIVALNEKLDIHILYGTEVDILVDGSLDYEDEVMAEFDFVVASIHSRMNQNNTDRILAAIEHPSVNCIGHISGRILGQRDGYELDYDTIFEAAAKHNVCIEINAQPSRLDIADMYIQRAKSYGVKFLVNTDSHIAQSLWLMELGVSVARRGWLTKEDVVNTYSYKDFITFFQK